MRVLDDKAVSIKMAEGKKMTGWLIPDMLGFMFTMRGMIGAIDNVKEALLFIIGITYLMARTYFYIKRQNVALKKDTWEQQQREKPPHSNVV